MESKSEQLIKMVADRLKGITESTQKQISDAIASAYNEQLLQTKKTTGKL